MTAPEPTVEDGQAPPPERPPSSPQLANTEETLEQAENSLVPVIVGAILAAYLLLGDDNDESYGPSWGVISKGALIPGKFMLKTAARGFREIVRGAVINALIPLLLAHLFWFERNAQISPGVRQVYRSSEQLRELAESSASFAMERAAEAMERMARDMDSPTSQEFYQAITKGPSEDQLEVFARRTARWLVRDTLFRAQEDLATAHGFTHKRWVSERDERVRSDHVRLDGKVVRVSAPFQVPSGSIRYPGDITAPVHLWINCRCSLEWLTR